MKKAVFLDRDGVLNRTVFRLGAERAPYEEEEFELFPDVIDSINTLKKNGFVTVVVTNQPDVARGWVSFEKVHHINNKIKQLLGVDDIKVCFHTDKDACDCRKPNPGMLLEAAREWGIDLESSFMVGDRHSDVEAGINAGCKTILVGPGDSKPKKFDAHYEAKSLSEATQWILKKALL